METGLQVLVTSKKYTDFQKHLGSGRSGITVFHCMKQYSDMNCTAHGVYTLTKSADYPLKGYFLGPDPGCTSLRSEVLTADMHCIPVLQTSN